MKNGTALVDDFRTFLVMSGSSESISQHLTAVEQTFREGAILSTTRNDHEYV